MHSKIIPNDAKDYKHRAIQGKTQFNASTGQMLTGPVRRVGYQRISNTVPSNVTRPATSTDTSLILMSRIKKDELTPAHGIYIYIYILLYHICVLYSCLTQPPSLLHPLAASLELCLGVG